MPRRPNRTTPEAIRTELTLLLSDFEHQLQIDNLRDKVLALIPAFHLLRDLGSSLIPGQESSARGRILSYFQKYPYIVIHGDELMVVSGIQEWPRRLRELRREYGWNIASGTTIREMSFEENLSLNQIDFNSIKPEEYILLNTEQDREAALRWRIANETRKKRESVSQKLIDFFRQNVGRPVTGEELRYVANNKTEWARRVRELHTEKGWPIATKNTGRPDLPVGVYVLEQDRQSPEHDRNIPNPIRRAVLIRDRFQCTQCAWSHNEWNRSDPRHLEIHHIKHHARGGENVMANLTTLCTICHDSLHREER